MICLQKTGNGVRGTGQDKVLTKKIQLSDLLVSTNHNIMTEYPHIVCPGSILVQN